MLWWWHCGHSGLSWCSDVSGASATAKTHLTELCGREHSRSAGFIQFLCVEDESVAEIKRQEPDVPNVGGVHGPDEHPPGAPRAAEALVPYTPMNPSRRSSASSRSRSARGGDSGSASGGEEGPDEDADLRAR